MRLRAALGLLTFEPLTLGFLFGFRFPSLHVAFPFLADAITTFLD
jgi:hypothetical protein